MSTRRKANAQERAEQKARHVKMVLHIYPDAKGNMKRRFVRADEA